MAKVSTMDRLGAVRSVGLFAGCNRRELEEVAALCTPVSVEEGFVLVGAGGVGRECFVVVDGKAAVTIAGERIATVGPGDCVGEMALLDGGVRTATVTAETPMTVYALSIREFSSLLALSPTIVRKITVALARRLRNLESERPH